MDFYHIFNIGGANFCSANAWRFHIKFASISHVASEQMFESVNDRQPTVQCELIYYTCMSRNAHSHLFYFICFHS